MFLLLLYNPVTIPMHHCKILNHIAKILSASDSWKLVAVLLDSYKVEFQQNFKIHHFADLIETIVFLNINYLMLLELDQSLPCSNTVPFV